MNVGFVSLGCSKNLIDTEMCIGLFRKENFNIVSNSEEADIIVVNTCGFIEPAKQEAINTILEMAELKKSGRCKYLIAMGCLVQRYKKDLEKALPEVDLFLSIDDYQNIWLKICELIGRKPDVSSQNTLEYEDRIISTGDKTAYLKIAEGCSNNCTYCAIPYIRGKYISRPFEEIIKEAKRLKKEGIEEVIVIAQDTTKYGMDLYQKARLPELLKEIANLGFQWVRFLYAYPESITDELIEVVKNTDNICHYFDIPIQHYSNQVLKRMNRKSNSEQINLLIQKIRKEIPDCILRTSLIVGFPGETEEDFFELYEFVNQAKFEKLGVFQYSKEDGTPASRLKEQIHPKTKQKRLNRIMELEQKISGIKLEEKIGNVYKVLIDGISEDNQYYIGRSYMDIPNEDGVIYMPKEKDGLVGKFVKCRIEDVSGYDFIGKIL
ncbi:MAG: 30S ribosomal protein S12 methylthiotransferase RimO [Clostridia bacterium]|nr:30S ribosomal protein S12 methylthiotransferase RimO [Clostridia bacterium]